MATRRRRPDHAIARNRRLTVRSSCRVEAPPQQLDLTPGELRADQGASVTHHWNHSSAAEPRFELVERQQDRERDETNTLIAFYTDRGVGCKYRPKKKGKKSRNINFETSDQFTQSGLTESRKVEWNKWKHFNAVYPVSGSELEQLLDQGQKPIPLQWVDIDKNEHKRREGWSLMYSVVQKSTGQPWRLGGNHWCENGLCNL